MSPMTDQNVTWPLSEYAGFVASRRTPRWKGKKGSSTTECGGVPLTRLMILPGWTPFME